MLIAPPYTISKNTINDICNLNLNYLEAEEFTRDLIEKGTATLYEGITLVYLPSLKGIEKFAESNTEKIYYFVYDYSEKSLRETAIQKFKTHKNTMHAPRFFDKDFVENQLSFFC